MVWLALTRHILQLQPVGMADCIYQDESVCVLDPNAVGHGILVYSIVGYSGVNTSKAKSPCEGGLLSFAKIAETFNSTNKRHQDTIEEHEMYSTVDANHNKHIYFRAPRTYPIQQDATGTVSLVGKEQLEQQPFTSFQYGLTPAELVDKIDAYEGATHFVILRVDPQKTKVFYSDSRTKQVYPNFLTGVSRTLSEHLDILRNRLKEDGTLDLSTFDHQGWEVVVTPPDGIVPPAWLVFCGTIDEAKAISDPQIVGSPETQAAQKNVYPVVSKKLMRQNTEVLLKFSNRMMFYRNLIDTLKNLRNDKARLPTIIISGRELTPDQQLDTYSRLMEGIHTRSLKTGIDEFKGTNKREDISQLKADIAKDDTLAKKLQVLIYGLSDIVYKSWKVDPTSAANAVAAYRATVDEAAVAAATASGRPRRAAAAAAPAPLPKQSVLLQNQIAYVDAVEAYKKAAAENSSLFEQRGGKRRNTRRRVRRRRRTHRRVPK